jgi:hypothetical protein
MLRKSLSRLILCLCLVSLLTISACNSQPPSRFDQAQQESISAGKRNTAVNEEAIQGAKLNDFFPKNSGEYERIFTQEKDGFVQAKLKFQGKDLATLAIFDTISNPSAKADFINATEKIQGFPLVEKGSTGTAVLVGDRYQVSIRSASPDFDGENRKEWLAKFDLEKLANLQ